MATFIDIDVPTLWAAWSDTSKTHCEVARSLGVSDRHLRRLAHRHRLPERPYVAYELQHVNDEQDGEETLELSPYVQRRIKELGLGYWADT